MTSKASQQLRLLSQTKVGHLEEDQIELQLINSSPFIAVGKSNSKNYPFVLVVPSGTVSKDEKTTNLLLVRSRLLEQVTSPNKEWPETVGVIGFKFLSHGAELIVDLLVDVILNSLPSVSADELIQDLIDIFKPTRGIEDQELVGLLGELAVISQASDIAKMVEAWHSSNDARYDFSFANARIEVKTSRGSRRIHFFSSAQLPPQKGINLKVISLLTEEVPNGTNVVSLFNQIFEVIPDHMKRKLLLQFNSVFTKDEDKCINTFFDLDLLFGSIKIFDGELVPSPTLVQGVISAKWEADITDLNISQENNELSALMQNEFS